MYLSSRHKNILCQAGIEVPSTGGGIGVSTSVRKYWRQHFQGVDGMQGTNDYVNTVIATDYSKAIPLHRFILKSGEPAEIRQSSSFLYIAVIRQNKRQDIIVVQPSYKEPPDDVRNYRLTDEWLSKVLSGELKRKK